MSYWNTPRMNKSMDNLNNQQFWRCQLMARLVWDIWFGCTDLFSWILTGTILLQTMLGHPNTLIITWENNVQ